MANVEHTFAVLGDGLIVATFTRNTGNGNITGVTVTNDSDADMFWRVLENDVERFTGTAPSNEVSTWPVAGIAFEQQPDYWNSVTEQWEPDGLDFGPWVIQARWPA